MMDGIDRDLAEYSKALEESDHWNNVLGEIGYNMAAINLTIKRQDEWSKSVILDRIKSHLTDALETVTNEQ